MNIKEIKEIIELMKENNINEFEIERDGFKISLKRGPSGIIQIPPAEAVAAINLTPQQKNGEAPRAAEELIKKNVIHITSPMVGTFYTAPSPDSPPYVVAGDEVKEGDVICIIEAMKVMNEIKAEMRGRVKEVLVKNGEAVEFSQPLFVIEKN